MLKLTKERQKLVLDNQQLVHYMLKKYAGTQEYDDLYSIGMVGLIKAASYFDKSRGIKFSTYAYQCIKGEFGAYYQKMSKRIQTISFNEIVCSEDGGIIVLEDTIQDNDTDLIETIERNETFEESINIVLNCLPSNCRSVILYRMDEVTVMEIAKRLNVTHQNVCQLESKALAQVRSIIQNNEKHSRVIWFDKKDDGYQISFKPKDVAEFYKVFAEFLKQYSDDDTLPDFQIGYKKGKVFITINEGSNIFSFIAKLCQMLEDTKCIPKIELELKRPPERMGQLAQLRAYMFSKDEFTLKELRKVFTNIPSANISGLVHYIKAKGQITAIGNGRYKVNKN